MNTKQSGSVDGSAEMAPYTYCQENINIYNTVKAGNPTTGDYIGFISLGYLQTYGDNGANMIGLNIAYNTAAAPSREHHIPSHPLLWHIKHIGIRRKPC